MKPVARPVELTDGLCALTNPRILVEPNAHHLLNLGDVGMLRIAVERLKALWPASHIGVITEAPDRLSRHCPGATSVSAAGRRLWFEDHYATYTLHRALPESMSDRLANWERASRRRWPHAVEQLIRMRAGLRHDDTSSLDEFLVAVSDADLVVSSGAGLFTDAFATLALTVLDLMETAKKGGAVTAAVGHGIGPITNAALLERAREVLPTLDLITLRESRLGMPLLDSLGVDLGRVLTTGDDALELAYRVAARAAPKRQIGLNLRIARYSGVDAAVARTVGRVLQGRARHHHATVAAIPISTHPREADAVVIASALGTRAPEQEPLAPDEIIESIGRCRVVVTGSYHAAVFALAQGIPAVGLTQSPYYDAKFSGLGDQFDGNVPVISLAGMDFEDSLGRAIDEAWERAEELRPLLLDAASRQVDHGRSSYGRLRGLLQPTG